MGSALWFRLYARDKPSELTPANFLAIYYRYAAPPAGARYQNSQGDFTVSHFRGPQGRCAIACPAFDLIRCARRSFGRRNEVCGSRQPLKPYSISSVSPGWEIDGCRALRAPARRPLSKLTTPNSASISPFALRQLTGWQRFIVRAAPIVHDLADHRGGRPRHDLHAAILADTVDLARRAPTRRIPDPLRPDPHDRAAPISITTRSIM